MIEKTDPCVCALEKGYSQYSNFDHETRRIASVDIIHLYWDTVELGAAFF